MRSWPLLEGMISYQVDSNIILNIDNEDPKWFDWSSQTLAQSAEEGKLWINPIIYAEVSVGFSPSQRS